jgi:hypothetical protein
MSFVTPGTVVAGEVLTATRWNQDVVANTQELYDTMGLVLIASVPFTSASSVSVNDCFSAAYQNYRIVYYRDGANDSGGENFRFRVGGSDDSNSVYDQQRLSGVGSSANAVANTAQAQFALFPAGNRANTIFQADVYRPFEAVLTRMFVTISQQNANGATSGVGVGGYYHRNSTSFDGFSVLNFTSGTGIVRVYGYGGA